MSCLYGWRQLETDYFKTHGNVENKSNSPFNFLTTICDHKVYTWNMTSQSIVVADYSDLVTEENEVEAQAYRVKTIVTFTPIHLDVKSHRGVYCLLWGNKGAALIQLPAVTFQSDQMKAASVFLGEKIHIECSKLNVLSAKLAVDNLKKVAAVLYDDKFLRIYDVVDGNVLEVICASNHYQSPLNMDVKLDATPHENPMDFDFGPIWPKSKFWTLFILRATGDIQYFLVRILDRSKRCITQEFRPITNDLGLDWKSGERATGVICITQFPTVVVVTCNTGDIFHSILIPNSSENKNYNAKSLELRESGRGNEIGELSDGQITSKQSSTPKAYNLETKMLESQVVFLGYERLITKSKDLKHLSFTKLIKDPLHEHRLICINDYGALIITVHSAEEFSRFMNNPLHELPREWTKPSIRWLLQWSLRQENSFKVLKGAAFSDSMPQSLLFVRGDSQSLTRGLPSPVDYQPLKLSSHLEPSSPFSNPAMYLQGSEKLSDKCGDFLDGNLKSLKKTPIPPLRIGEHAIKIKEARSHINSAISSSMDVIITINEVSALADEFTAAFKERSAGMSSMLLKLMQAKVSLKDQAELLAEKYEEKLEADQSFKMRIEGMLRILCRSNPVFTDKEKFWLKNLENIGDDIIDLQGLVEGLKRKVSLLDPPCSLPNKLRLTPSQLKLIKDELQAQHQALLQLTLDVRQITEYASWQTDTATNQQ